MRLPRLKSVRGVIDREMEKQIIQGSSTVLTNLESMAGFGTGYGGTTGWFSNAAFGSQTNTIGGIAQATWPTKFQHHLVDVADNFAANGQAKMAQVHVDAMTYTPEGSISRILASSASYVLYKNDLQAQERYMSASESVLDGGKLALAYNGAKMVVNPWLGFSPDAGVTYISMYFLNPALIRFYFHKDAYFAASKFMDMEGNMGKQMTIMVRVQIAPLHLAGHGVVINAEL